MKIGIDARLLQTEKFTGISRSVHEILKVWSEEYKDNEYYLFTVKPIHLNFKLSSNWHIVLDPCIKGVRRLWSIVRLPYLIKKHQIDIFWGTNYELPLKVKNVKYIVTIYDLAIFKMKNIGERKNEIRLKMCAKSACRKAEKIVAISQATAIDIEKVFGFPEDKIIVSYCGGLPSGYKKNTTYDKEKLKPELHFKEKFFLFLSTIEPRKNIITIVNAFEKYIDNTDDKNVKLVLAGGKGWRTKDILQSIHNNKYRDNIILPGFISDNDKSYLLNKATAFIYPSLYEGFGIPILEAFAYGIPVVTSYVSSMPEVGGDAAFYLKNVNDADELARLYETVVNLTEIDKTKLVDKMKKQLKKFSWEKNAREMMSIIRNI